MISYDTYIMVPTYYFIWKQNEANVILDIFLVMTRKSSYT